MAVFIHRMPSWQQGAKGHRHPTFYHFEFPTLKPQKRLITVNLPEFFPSASLAGESADEQGLSEEKSVRLVGSVR